MVARRITYVICYDIPEDKRRNELARCLDGFGDRVQYSVFEAALTSRLFDNLVSQIEEIIEPNEDSVNLYPICASCMEKALFFGDGKLEERPGREIVFIV